MPIHSTQSSLISQHSLTRALSLALILFMLVGLTGCTTLWDRIRENERTYSIETARTQAGRGQCSRALQTLDRAQARIDLGSYARESTVARARCYEKLKLEKLAYAHRRLIDDFYTDEPMAFPDADGSSTFRVKTIPPGGFVRPPKWLQLPAPRYSPYAQRSKIVGRVVISFEIARNNTPKKIRVLEMGHPLLATWAIESISQAKGKKKTDTPKLMPGGRYVTTFLFEWRWAKEAPEEKFDS